MGWLGCSAPPVHAPEIPPKPPLERRYHVAESISYRMHGDRDGHRYDAMVSGVVKQDADGVFFEDLGWTSVAVDDRPVTLSAEQLAVHQQLSLDPRFRLRIPDLRAAHPALIGPMLDLMTFYADYQIGARRHDLVKLGDHAYVTRGTPNSWANPAAHVIVGEDSIDFDLTITAPATVVVKHVPPAVPQIPLPAPWMEKGNNWVQVVETADGNYVAGVGRETFDVSLTLDPRSGAILGATMTNPVDLTQRTCTDAALTTCGPPEPRHIMRRIEIAR
jgi:hypothetical protein